MTEPSDRAAILARRALLVSSALASFQCAPATPADPVAPESSVVVLPSASAAPEPSTSATSAAPTTPVPPLPAWAEQLKGAPEPPQAESLPASIKEAWVGDQEQLKRALETIGIYWAGAPELCSPTAPGCKDAWRKLGAQLKASQDALRSLEPGLCSGGRSPLALQNTFDKQKRFASESLNKASEHWSKVASSFGLLAEQEWQKHSANAVLIGPRPCLSCMQPERMAMYETIKFAGTDTALDAAGLKSVEELAPRLKMAKRFEVWGFGAAEDKDPMKGAQARLDAVAKALASKGISKGNFTLVPVGAGWTDQGAVEFVMLTR
jgi:hypothetical protein